MGVTRINRDKKHTVIEWHCAYPNPLVRPHMIANVLASWVNFCRWLADMPNAAPHQVEFEFALEQTLWPDASGHNSGTGINHSSNSDTSSPGINKAATRKAGRDKLKEAYQAVFNCPVLFSQPRSALIIDNALLDIPLRQPDQLLRQTLETHASQQIASLAEPGHSLTIQARNLIRRYLGKRH
jgi:hypothetical protein